MDSIKEDKRHSIHRKLGRMIILYLLIPSYLAKVKYSFEKIPHN